MPYEYQKHVTYAGILMIICLTIAVLAMIRITPIIFALFFTAGMLAAAMALLLYLYVVIKDLKLHRVI